MRFATTAAAAALVMISLTSCVVSPSTPSRLGGQTELSDDLYHAEAEISGRALSIPDAPAAVVGATWNDSATEFPGYLSQIVDPFNYPHLIWRAFYTVWTIPINPLYHVTDQPTEDWDRYVSPVRETVSYDVSPTPHGGDAWKYWASRSDSHVKHVNNIAHTLKYSFLNTNSLFPPYDRFYPEQIQADKTLLHKTFDVHLFRYDWDDPYID